jgi:hypothetical protein
MGDSQQRHIYLSTRLSRPARKAFKIVKEAKLIKLWSEVSDKFAKKIENHKAHQQPSKAEVPNTYRDILITN